MGKSRAREVILDRQKKVEELHIIRKYTIAETAKALGWSPRVIDYDLKKIRARGTKKDKNIFLSETLQNELSSYDKAIQRAWIDYDNEKYGHNKVKFLDLITQIALKRAQLLKDYHILPKEPQNIINININKYEEDLERAREKWKQSYLIKKKKQESLTAQ